MEPDNGPINITRRKLFKKKNIILSEAAPPTIPVNSPFVYSPQVVISFGSVSSFTEMGSVGSRVGSGVGSRGGSSIGTLLGSSTGMGSVGSRVGSGVGSRGGSSIGSSTGTGSVGSRVDSPVSVGIFL